MQVVLARCKDWGNKAGGKDVITSCVCSQTLGQVGVVTKQGIGMHVQVSLNGKRLGQQIR